VGDTLFNEGYHLLQEILKYANSSGRTDGRMHKQRTKKVTDILGAPQAG